MQRLAISILFLCAAIISAASSALLWMLGAASGLEAVLIGGLVLQAFCLAFGAYHLNRNTTALAQFAQAAQTHFLTLEHSQDAALDDVESLSARMSALKRDLVGHLKSHANLPADAGQYQAASTSGLGPVLGPVTSPEPVPTLNASQSIASAILSNRIDLFVQPTVTLPARKTVFYECLSRLRSEAGDTLYPSSYLAHVTQSKLIGTLDNFLLLRCVQIIRKLHRKAPLETFFLNISAASLGDPEFYDQFIDFLEGDKSLSEHLVLELQSDDLETLLPVIAPGLDRLRAAGYCFAIDGAHPSDITPSVSNNGFKFAKVAARYITALEDAQGLVEQSADLGVTLIATHVEDEKTLINLTEYGVSHAQGFLIAKPAPWDQIDRQKLLSGAA